MSTWPRISSIRVHVVEDVHLAADLVDLVEVVPGPLELGLDQRTAEIDGGPRGAGAEVVRGLLESADADGRPQCVPAGDERLLGGQGLEEQRHAPDTHLARDQLADLDLLPIAL